MKVLNLSEYVLRYAEDHGELVTNLKLQKTLYYLQGYSLKQFNETAFDEDILNWQYGPVSPIAYFAYSNYGADPLESNPNRKIEKVDAKHTTLFDKVIDTCLKIPARVLVQKTHDEDPWKTTTQNQKITVSAISDFFCANDPLNIGAVC